MDIQHYLTESTVIALIILFIVFLIIRQFALWYWKVNQINSKLESIDEHLEQIAGLLTEKLNPKELPEAETVELEPSQRNAV